MKHTEESLMALAADYGVMYAAGQQGGWNELQSAIREVLAERDALAAAMPSEGADAALAYAVEKSARERAEAECERLRNLLREARQCVHKEANDEREMEGRGYYCDLAERINAAIKEQP